MMVEDQVMWFKVSLNTRIYYDSECLTFYRVHPASFCASTPSDRQALTQACLYLRLLGFLKAEKGRIAKVRLLRAMARSRLCAALLEYQMTEVSCTRGRKGGDPLSEAVPSFARLELGAAYGAVLAVGRWWRRAALALCRGSFRWCRLAYRHGVGTAPARAVQYVIRWFTAFK
jgi:hypothetical protein